jgi:hypothetical protein
VKRRDVDHICTYEDSIMKTVNTVWKKGEEKRGRIEM